MLSKSLSTFFCLTLLFSASILSALPEPTTGKLKALYNSLDPSSIAQHLAFYQLYAHTPEGQKALNEAYRLLNGGNPIQFEGIVPTKVLNSSIQAIISLVNKPAQDADLELNEEELYAINILAKRLPNRRLPGYQAQSEDAVLRLTPPQIDLARGVLLSQLGSDARAMLKIRSYEAALDLMALQILTRIKLSDSPQMKIRAINRFIFEEMGYRFPPHSTYAKDIDVYTFLPSVLDSRRGVCLGVSILYICLAQRLNLELEIVTPPGHIYVRWHKGTEQINIETTARGVDLPDTEYLGVDTRKLQQRNIKETIGMAHFNQASVFLEREQYDKAMAAYKQAQKYLEGDKHLMNLMGATALLQGDEAEGQRILSQIVDYLPEEAVSKDTLAEDYLNGKASKEAVSAVFMHVDETRESLLKKKDVLQGVLKKNPHFREGIFSLAGTWLQLHRTGEALEVLKQYHAIDSSNAAVEYYLAVLHAQRFDYNNAWRHLNTAENIVKARNHQPEALSDFRYALSELSPE